EVLVKDHIHYAQHGDRAAWSCPVQRSLQRGIVEVEALRIVMKETSQCAMRHVVVCRVRADQLAAGSEVARELIGKLSGGAGVDDVLMRAIDWMQILRHRLIYLLCARSPNIIC